MAWVVTPSPLPRVSAAVDTRAQTVPCMRVFVVLVNFSGSFSDGHIVPTAVSAAQAGIREISTEETASVACVHALLWYGHNTRILSPLHQCVSVDVPSGSPTCPPLGSSSAQLVRRVGWADHLSAYSASFDAEVALREGLWVRLPPWWAGILELFPLVQS